jgi:hypothetical protein
MLALQERVVVTDQHTGKMQSPNNSNSDSDRFTPLWDEILRKAKEVGLRIGLRTAHIVGPIDQSEIAVAIEPIDGEVTLPEPSLPVAPGCDPALSPDRPAPS